MSHHTKPIGGISAHKSKGGGGDGGSQQAGQADQQDQSSQISDLMDAMSKARDSQMKSIQKAGAAIVGLDD